MGPRNFEACFQYGLLFRSRRSVSTLFCRPSGLFYLHRNFLGGKNTTVLAIPKVFVKFERKIPYLDYRASKLLDFKKETNSYCNSC